MEVNPLCIILVKSDSKGDRLLFRYPFRIQEKHEPSGTKRRNLYALTTGTGEDLLQSPPQHTSNIYKGYLTGFSDETLSSLFAVKLELCNKKFEIKVNDVRFVSHPTRLQRRSKRNDDRGFLLINIVFALQALASKSVVKCYHELSERIGIAVKHEEERDGFLEQQTLIMTAAHDEGCSTNHEAVFQNIVEKCTLAQNIQKMYEDLCTTGSVNIRINRWIPLTFCLPQKVHQEHLNGRIIDFKDIKRCLKALRPYHSLLLLCNVEDMNSFVSIDSSPTLVRMLSHYSPLKNLQALAADTDITLNHIFQLTAHLVYWAKAIVIYPICSTNKYVISSDASIHLHSPLVEKFSTEFPDSNLLRVINEFSLPTSLGQKANPLNNPSQQSQLVKMIIWMLQHHLLIQLHTYIQFMPSIKEQPLSPKNAKRMNGGRNVSQSSPLSSLPNSESQTESGSIASSFSALDGRLDSDNSNTISDSFLEHYHDVLSDFPKQERLAMLKVPAASNVEDLNLFARLCHQNYFQGNHHIEEIMYLENLRRSQLLQLLDKFRDVLITYETEDNAIAMVSNA